MVMSVDLAGDLAPLADRVHVVVAFGHGIRCWRAECRRDKVLAVQGRGVLVT